jgi:hypothetical protein
MLLTKPALFVRRKRGVKILHDSTAGYRYSKISRVETNVITRGGSVSRIVKYKYIDLRKYFFGPVSENSKV